MKLLQKILVPTDFRGSAENAIEMAIELAKIFDSEIILLHVLPAGWDAKNIPIKLDKIVAEQLETLREKLNKLEVKTADPIITTGNLYDEMIKTAEIHGVNLIMMGSGDKPANDHFPVGTTTEKVMRKSNKPVWVVKQNSSVTINHIMCPVDYSEPSKRALSNAIHLARGLKVEMTVLTVLESFADQLEGLNIKLEPESEKLKSAQETEFDKFLSGFDFHGVNWAKQIRRGKPHQEILKALQNDKNSLLVMGTNGRSGFNRALMGSVAERVTRELPCSFITVKSEEFIRIQLQNEIQDLETHFEEGQKLLANGFAKEAINQFELCVAINSMYVPAWLGMASAYERLKMNDKAQGCHSQAKDIREHLTNRKIEAEIRSKNWLFR